MLPRGKEEGASFSRLVSTIVSFWFSPTEVVGGGGGGGGGVEEGVVRRRGPQDGVLAQEEGKGGLVVLVVR
jgi:hypothetical protein